LQLLCFVGRAFNIFPLSALANCRMSLRSRAWEALTPL
jgi:hypothetical protein